MTTGDPEAQRAEELRELARQYCDGAFNKGEYRRQRRDILQHAVRRDYAAAPAPDDEDESPVLATPAQPALPQDWLPHIMVGVTLMVVVMMGYLLYTLA